MLFDEPGDGALWARGGAAYKARFDAENATYYPLFGPRTPRHYPLSLRLDSVTLDGRELAFERGVPYRRDGSIVSYDRGSLIELYELRPDSMEQLFHFDRLPRGGELVLRMAPETELQVFASATGFELANEHGRVGYTRAVAIDRLDRRQELATSFADGVIEIRVPAAFLDEAAFPLTIDPVIDIFDVSADPDVDAYSPDVAYDETTNRYTIVWEKTVAATDHDVYSTLWSTGSLPILGSQVGIDFTTDC